MQKICAVYKITQCDPMQKIIDIKTLTSWCIIDDKRFKWSICLSECWTVP